MNKTKMKEFATIWNDINHWQLATFGEGDTLIGKLNHLILEINEVIADPHDPTEWADLFILAFGTCASQGFSPEEILEAIAAKMVINKSRKWGKPDQYGVIRQIKEAT